MELRCTLCGPATGRVIWAAGPWSLVRCRSCGLVATQPAPEPELLRRLYDDPDYHETRSDASLEAWGQRAREILAGLPAPPPTAILDFGAGEGHLVASLRSLGIHAEGVEPSASSQAAALRVHGIALHSQLPVDASARFDAATLLHSLEHVPDPVGALKQIRSGLTTDGSIFIEVPHAGSPDMLLPSHRRDILDLPLHLHHFTPRTLERVATAAGFSRVELRLFNCTPLERALARRNARADPRPAPVSRDGPGAHDERVPRRKAVWSGVLDTARHVLPGPKFQWIGRVRGPTDPWSRRAMES